MISRRHYKMGNLFGRKGILNNVGDILQARITHDNKKF
jgi:hypothetical protein